MTAYKQMQVNPSSVTAAGTTQAGATALSNSFDYHLVGTVGANAGTKFAVLTSAQVGRRVIVRCARGAANTLRHYPPTGGTIGEQAANAYVTIEPNVTIEFLSVSTIDWVTVSP